MPDSDGDEEWDEPRRSRIEQLSQLTYLARRSWWWRVVTAKDVDGETRRELLG